MMYCASSAHAYRFYINLVSDALLMFRFKTCLAVRMRLRVAYSLRLQRNVVQQCNVVACGHQI